MANKLIIKNVLHGFKYTKKESCIQLGKAAKQNGISKKAVSDFFDKKVEKAKGAYQGDMIRKDYRSCKLNALKAYK